ncbi:MAG: DUF2797 domain-containing protein [Candidatus Micrarchaeota archaeon]|nr:DUF2797 domain-containing protein [Candidatus Micrarchaeota archaeon]
MRHLLRFYFGEGKPQLIFRDFDQLGMLELEVGKYADIDFSSRLSCIGYKSPGGYFACPNHALNVRQCSTCSYLDVSRAYTVGDFSAYPELYKEAQQEEYCVYLAQFGSQITKCGVTRVQRFLSRMLEQGADFGCIIAKFCGPDLVYAIEEELQARFLFANSVRMSQKLRLFSFDRQEAKEKLACAIELVRSSGIVPDFDPQIHDFSSYYPKVDFVQQASSVLGEVLGAKGEFLVFRSELGKAFAVNMKTQVGHFFELRQ